MNTVEELIPIMRHAAKKVASCRHPIEDIVQEMWVLGRIQKVPKKFMSRRAQWDAIEVVRNWDGLRNKNTGDAKFRVRNPFIQSVLNSNNNEHYDFGPFVKGRQEEVDFKDWIDWLKPKLNRREQLILELYYIENMPMKEIGIVIGFSESLVSVNHTIMLDRIRKIIKGTEE